mmetsp:Transcript_9139/g.33519  ORF Transcript_9139/g.33519 Transcript_9139/m.33519 type:complete len:237 (-) Transcript_9139:275-985(-)
MEARDAVVVFRCRLQPLRAGACNVKELEPGQRINATRGRSAILKLMSLKTENQCTFPSASQSHPHGKVAARSHCAYPLRCAAGSSDRRCPSRGRSHRATHGDPSSSFGSQACPNGKGKALFVRGRTSPRLARSLRRPPSHLRPSSLESTLPPCQTLSHTPPATASSPESVSWEALPSVQGRVSPDRTASSLLQQPALPSLHELSPAGRACFGLTYSLRVLAQTLSTPTSSARFYSR